MVGVKTGVQRLVFRVWAIVALLLGVRYLAWRCLYGFNAAEAWWSLVVLGAEAFLWWSLAGFVFSQWRRTPRLQTLSEPPPYVDIWIVRNTESSRAAVQTAETLTRSLDYPWHRVFVHILDTQADAELARLASAVPCEYHACDGIHTALSQVLRQAEGIGEYILLLQAGHFPDPDIVRASLPYFESDVAYVQTELRSLNRSIVDHPLLQLIPMGVAGGDAAPCLGSGAIFRRQALAELPNADWLMPVRLGSYLHQAGWRSHLCRETGVSGGLLLFRNRLMALLALMPTLRIAARPRKASQIQRFQYLWLGLWSLSGLSHFVLMLVPVFFLTLGLKPVPAFDATFLKWFAPYTLVRLSGLFIAFPGRYWWRMFEAHRQSVAQFAQSMLAVLMRGRDPQPTQPTQVLLWPQAVMWLIVAIAIGIGGRRFLALDDPAILEWACGFGAALYTLVLLGAIPPGVHWGKD